MVEVDGYRVMTDTVLSRRTSPVQFFGPARFHPAPIPLTQLTGIDAVVISHNHYDHLDEATIKKLAAEGTRFFLPFGIGVVLDHWGVPAAQITELNWWHKATIGELNITATPARHYPGRGLFDYGATQWASWMHPGPKTPRLLQRRPWLLRTVQRNWETSRPLRCQHRHSRRVRSRPSLD
jgi:L-ascorbate metabolism protein UlaG (beta-lactamase superfamily)